MLIVNLTWPSIKVTIDFWDVEDYLDYTGSDEKMRPLLAAPLPN